MHHTVRVTARPPPAVPAPRCLSASPVVLRSFASLGLVALHGRPAICPRRPSFIVPAVVAAMWPLFAALLMVPAMGGTSLFFVRSVPVPQMTTTAIDACDFPASSSAATQAHTVALSHFVRASRTRLRRWRRRLCQSVAAQSSFFPRLPKRWIGAPAQRGPARAGADGL